MSKDESVLPYTKVVVHPIVLLNVVDHYTRMSKIQSPDKRVVGILLGNVGFDGVVDVLNTYAVPFDEDESVWFFDHNYHETLAAMSLKVNHKEKIVGWYSTDCSPDATSDGRIKPFDTEINKLISNYVPNPIYVIVNVNFTSTRGLPIEAYVAVEEVTEELTSERPAATATTPQDLSASTGASYAKHPVAAVHFRHLPYDVSALEAEAIGVEHLLRDIPDREGRLASITQRVNGKADALGVLIARLEEIRDYLERVAAEEIKPNQKIIENVQGILNLIPDVEGTAAGLGKALAIDSNDVLSVVYVGALTKSVIALHDLIANREATRLTEAKAEEKRKMTKEKADSAEKPAKK